jgi:lipoprotein-releasing system ATP-binding protein
VGVGAVREDPVVLGAQGVAKAYTQGDRPVEVLRGVDLTLRRGEMVALMGASGAGKSTLLHILGLLERPDAGHLVIAGQTVTGLTDRAATRLRRSTIGFVYQFHHLLPEFTAAENIALAQMIAGAPRRAALDKAMDLLGSFGLADRAGHRPAQLSGGQAQRVAIARALANAPALLLADEPTGNLDPDTAARVLQVLVEQVRARGLAAVIATHNPALATQMDRVETMAGGRLEGHRPAA